MMRRCKWVANLGGGRPNRSRTGSEGESDKAGEDIETRESKCGGDTVLRG